ncbi:MAG: hypothetical protein AAGM22_00420 [Acidobacteriota bacterium]
MIYIAAPISPEMAQEMDDLLNRIRTSDKPSRLSRDGADFIMRLTETCLDYYYLRSVKALGLGLMATKATQVGLKTAVSGISVFVKQASRMMSDEQVIKLADLVEELVLEVEDDGGDD